MVWNSLHSGNEDERGVEKHCGYFLNVLKKTVKEIFFFNKLCHMDSERMEEEEEYKFCEGYSTSWRDST
jgi:hypothetical protein